VSDLLACPVPADEEAVTPKFLRNIKGIIFDFDGTLFDNALIPFYLIAAYPPDWLRLRRERLIRKRFAGCDFPSTDGYYRAFFEALGEACSRSPDYIRNWYFNSFSPRMVSVLRKRYKPRPGAKEFFQRVCGKEKPLPKTAVYSDYPFVGERMEAIGLSAGPEVRLYGPESFGAQKPAARPYLRIAGDLGVMPEEILVVGDREETDGLGAFRAGMRFFCLETGRKRYFRLDPYRRYIKEKPHGPSLLMYTGTWHSLQSSLMEHFFR